MNSNQVYNAAKSYENDTFTFGGVVTNDDTSLLKNLTRNNFFFIANTLSSKDLNMMGHWTVFVISGSILFFIDSYGMNPSSYGGIIHDFFSYFPLKKKLL